MDLYDRDLAGARFRRLCGGNQQEQDMESCVELAPIPDEADAFALRDSSGAASGKSCAARPSGDRRCRPPTPASSRAPRSRRCVRATGC
ncbi:hypothetical protein [Microbispora rosea]|uniref:hypothetical protein n=1 Tax=Microbispora rosea TaxID=58117 RepID=UPI000AC932FA|nr:hypothetical protein [Microbispora rosea]